MSNDMSNPQVTAINSTNPNELARFRKEWWVFLLLGILLILAGVACVAYPFFTSVGVMIFIGVTLMLAGVSLIISAFWTGKWSAFILQILIGLLYVVAGFLVADAPIASAALFTLMIAGFFVVAGIFRIIYSLMERFPQWGWVLFNGIVTLILGLIIFKSFKQFSEGESTTIFWIIGLLVGLELVFNGWTWVMLSFMVKGLPEVESESPSDN